MQSIFSQRLESLRGALTQRQFAKSLGVPLTTYTNWLAGISTPKIDVVTSICSKLGVSADWLLGLPGGAPPADVSDAQVAALKAAVQAVLDKF